MNRDSEAVRDAGYFISERDHYALERATRAVCLLACIDSDTGHRNVIDPGDMGAVAELVGIELQGVLGYADYQPASIREASMP